MNWSYVLISCFIFYCKLILFVASFYLSKIMVAWLHSINAVDDSKSKIWTTFLFLLGGFFFALSIVLPGNEDNDAIIDGKLGISKSLVILIIVTSGVLLGLWRGRKSMRETKQNGLSE